VPVREFRRVNRDADQEVMPAGMGVSGVVRRRGRYLQGEKKGKGRGWGPLALQPFRLFVP
jgi:hypothetical protein